LGKQPLDGLAIELDGVERPSLLLVFVRQFPRLREMVPNRPHPNGEFMDRIRSFLVLQVPHHVLAVLDGFDRVQRTIEKRRDVVFLLAHRDRGDDMVEIEVAEKWWRLGGLW